MVTLKQKLRLLGVLAVGLLSVALIIAYNNNVSAPGPGDTVPIPATGNAEDAAAAIIQGAAVEDSIMAEADSDLDLIEADSDAVNDFIGAYDEDSI